jgi:hypothetical protein
MAPPDQAIDNISPVDLDNRNGHEDGPTTSKSLDPVHDINNMAGKPCRTKAAWKSFSCLILLRNRLVGYPQKDFKHKFSQKVIFLSDI